MVGRISFLVVLGAVVAGCGHSHGDVSSILALEGDATSGAAHFDATCANADCHGADGVEGPGPSLADAVPDHDDEALMGVIRFGEGNMPAQDSLDDQAVADVVAHLRGRFP